MTKKIGILILVILGVAALCIYVQQRKPTFVSSSSNSTQNAETATSKDSTKTGATANNPSIDVPSASEKTLSAINPSAVTGTTQEKTNGVPAGGKEATTSQPLRTPQNYGRALPVKANANPQVASVAEALKDGKHPERLTAMIPAPPFDKAKFLADPKAYTNEIVPGRCQQCADPSPSTPALTAEGPRFHNLVQGESVKLTVKGAPHGATTFVSQDMGYFSESKLSCVSVQADEKGLASVTFVASAGALNDVNILVASPMASHQVAYKIEISEKK